jgi:putative oxidoreductase
MTNNLDTRLNANAPIVLSIFRVIFGLLFICHASAHLFGWPSGPAAGVGQWPYFYAGVIEIVTGLLITLGLFTRIAAFIASGTMAFAFFYAHLPNGVVPMINGGEPAVLYCFAFLLLVFTGGGAFALDARRNSGRAVTQRSVA